VRVVELVDDELSLRRIQTTAKRLNVKTDILGVAESVTSETEMWTAEGAMQVGGLQPLYVPKEILQDPIGS